MSLRSPSDGLPTGETQGVSRQVHAHMRAQLVPLPHTHTHTHTQPVRPTQVGDEKPKGTSGASPLPGQNLLQAFSLICSPLSSTQSPACRQIFFSVKNLSSREELLPDWLSDAPLICSHAAFKGPRFAAGSRGWHPAGPSVSPILVQVDPPTPVTLINSNCPACDSVTLGAVASRHPH